MNGRFSRLSSTALAAGAPSGTGAGRRGRTGSGLRESDPGEDVVLALTLGPLRARLARQLADDGFHVVPADDTTSLAERLAQRGAGIVIASTDLPGLDTLAPSLLGETPLLLVVPPRAAARPPPILGRALGVLHEPVDTDDIRTIVWNTVR